MSLSKRIADTRDAELMADAAQRLEADRERKDDDKKRIEVVTHALISVAQSIQEECEPLDNRIELPKYFRFSDYIMMTKLYESTNKMELASPDEPKLVIAQYYVALVGIDKRTGKLEYIRVGMLGWLNFKGLYKAIVAAPSYVDFDPDKVIEQLVAP